MPRATWFCVDLECSGPAPALFDMLSVGVVPVFDEPNGRRIGEPLYVEIQPTGAGVDPGAMKIHGLDLATLARDGLPLAEALDVISAFVRAQTVAGSEPVFVGHNAPFDWAFVNHAYHATRKENPFGYKAFDTKALAAGVLGLHWLDTSKEVLAERLPLPPVEAGKVHRADWDAWYQAHILVGLLDLQGR